jgi:hypothetical protein
MTLGHLFASLCLILKFWRFRDTFLAHCIIKVRLLILGGTLLLCCELDLGQKTVRLDLYDSEA